MTPVDTSTEPAAIPPARLVESHWPISMVFLTAWWLPATTARRTGHVSLRGAFVIHLIAVVATLIVLANTPLLAGPLRRAGMRTLLTPSVEHILRIVLIAIVSEFMLALLAFALMSWGAADEPARESFRNSLRQVWLHTANFLAVSVVLTICGLCGAGGLPVWRNHGEIVSVIGLAVGVWLLAMLLRAIGARREVAVVHRQPYCEGCGYDLTTRSMDSFCPECALPVVQSLGPLERPGTPWDRRRDIGRAMAWCDSLVAAAFEPARLGRVLRVSSRVVDHRLFLAVHVAILFLVGYLGVIGLYLKLEHRSPFSVEPMVAYFIAPWVGTVTAVGSLLGAIASATLIGLSAGRSQGRNLMPAAMQIVAYLGGLGVCLVAVLWLILIHLIQAIVNRTLPPGVGQIGWLLLVLGAIFVCLLRLYQGTCAARYANH